ncbi:hypothetical protein [Eubacterium ventriosum]|nr:hypothetical protein [Eubacterium ventriosum]DAP43730.1 MAG TPA: hypothetical protein [Caudoviricetes sp.]
MSTVEALKKLAVTLKCAASEEEIKAATIPEAILFIAENMPSDV